MPESRRCSVTVTAAAVTLADVDASKTLRRGWTTGSCATAAASAAWAGLLTGDFPDPVTIALPGGGVAAFALAETGREQDTAWAGVVKDAGDDPDVTHGALVRVLVSRGASGGGIVFRAGPGVGTVTRPGLPVPPGEPAINPMPRQMIRDALGAVDAVVTIGIDDGERIARQTLNARLGIVGGLSILGTTGVVVPYSCAAWIHTIHRGIDVARAGDFPHVAGATGSNSEAAVRDWHQLPDPALIDMGDFVGGMLKYLRTHPVPRVTIAGGVAKITKLAQGRLDLHSRRGMVDLPALAALAGGGELGAQVIAANTTAEAFGHAAQAGIALGDLVAAQAWQVAAATLDRADCQLEIMLFDRDRRLVGHAPFDHAAPAGPWPPRNRRR